MTGLEGAAVARDDSRRPLLADAASRAGARLAAARASGTDAVVMPNHDRKGTRMTPVTWRGHTAIVADGDELVEVDCSRLFAAMAPVDITKCVDRIAFATRVITMTLNAGSAIMATPFSQFSPGLVCVWASGLAYNLGEVHYVADAGPDARLTVFFEQADDMAEAA